MPHNFMKTETVMQLPCKLVYRLYLFVFHRIGPHYVESSFLSSPPTLFARGEDKQSWGNYALIFIHNMQKGSLRELQINQRLVASLQGFWLGGVMTMRCQTVTRVTDVLGIVWRNLAGTR